MSFEITNKLQELGKSIDELVSYIDKHPRDKEGIDFLLGAVKDIAAACYEKSVIVNGPPSVSIPASLIVNNKLNIDIDELELLGGLERKSKKTYVPQKKKQDYVLTELYDYIDDIEI